MTMVGERILIIDDESSIRKMFGLILSREGYNVTEAEEGNEGLLLIGSEEYDLVLLDIMMPGITGIECLERIKETHPELPVIMVTGVINVETTVEATEKGAFDYIIKPAKRADLVGAVKRVLNAREG